MTEYEIYGTTSDERAGTFFFQPRPEPRSLMELVEAAGMDAAHVKLSDEPGAEVAVGEWAGLSSVARVRDFPEHVALEIYFSQLSFFHLYDGMDPTPDELALEDDPALPVAHAFRDACLRLRTQVGLLTLSNIVSASDYVERQIYPLVRRWDGYRLAVEAGLLYVAEDLKYNLFDMPGIEERDQLPVDEGMLVFSQAGPDRWY